MKTFIFGASGHAKEVLWIIKEINKLAEEVIVVDKFVVAENDPLLGGYYDSISIISESAYLENYANQVHNCILAIGSSKIRKNILNKIVTEKTQFPSLIHPSVIYDKTRVKIGKGVIIEANVTLTTDINIADFVHVNIGSTISHDVQINSFVTISPSVHIAGNVTLKENVFLGINSTIIERLTICENTTIGAGALVLKEITDAGTYVGIPARKIK